MPHADQKYIDALLTNNATLLNELYQKFSGKIKAMVLRNGGTEVDARDVLQEALLSIYKKARATGLALNCPMDAFLYVVCRNKWRSELLKRGSAQVTFQDTESYSIEESKVWPADEVQKEQGRTDLLQKKLAALDESCRRLLLLCWRKKTLQEVAEALQITYGYARKKKSGCMARLMELVRTDPDFENLK